LKGTNKRESYYAQDQWKAGRFTANLGVRLDNIRGEIPKTGKDVYKTFSVGPRLGFALDLTGKGTSVLRAYYGRLYDGATQYSWNWAAPGASDYVTYAVGPNWGSLTEIDRSPAESKYTVADKIKHPRVDEYNIAWEQQFGRTFKFTSTFIYRSWANFIGQVLINGQWTPATTTNPISGTLPIYKWANRNTIPEQYLVQNVDSLTFQLDNGTTVAANPYRKYEGIMFVLQRAYKNRWQGQVSYVLSNTHGTVSNSTSGGIYSSQFNTPNTIVGMYDGRTGYSRAHEVKAFVGYQVPVIEVAVNGYFTYLSGWPYAANRSVSSSTLNYVSSLTVNVDERGSSAPQPVTKKSIYQVTDPEARLDVRFEKVFKYGVHRFGVYVDVQNLSNQGAVTSRQTRYPNRSLTDVEGNGFTSNFGDPLYLQNARQVTFGARWSF
jgi:hypothetical protein